MKVTIAAIKKLKATENIDLLRLTQTELTDIDNISKIVEVCTGSAAAADEFMTAHTFGEVIEIITSSLKIAPPQKQDVTA